MPVSVARKNANRKYDAKAYEQVMLRVKRGRKATLQAHAAAQGDSINGFINRAIDEAMERDNEKAPH